MKARQFNAIIHAVCGLMLAFGCFLGISVRANAAPSHDNDPAIAPLQLDPSLKDTFMSAWEAASRGDLPSLDQAIHQLRQTHPDSPLLPYLLFEALRQRVDQTDEATMTQFLAKYRHWSFADQLERNWLRSLGQRGQYDVLLRYLEQTGQVAGDDEIRCHVAQAKVLAKPAPDGAEYRALMNELESLWRVGKSQHKACDRPFDWWRARSGPSHAVAWSRFLLAVKQNERSLAGYLQRYLSTEQRLWASRWLEMARYPNRALTQARRWPDNEAAHELIRWGLINMARRDWAEASAHWAILESRMAFDAPDQLAIAREIALFQAVALDVGALERIDQLPSAARDAQLLMWRARVAMVHGQWDEVLTSVQQLPASEQISARWRYWRGRALAELGRPDAVLAYASVSGEANYYGFLSAKKLGQPLSLCPETLAIDPLIRQSLMGDPALERAMALYQVGLLDHARATWFKWLITLPEAHQHQAALLASEVGWHDRAVATLASSGKMRAYTLRFPLDHTDEVGQAANQHRVDQALIYGLMRAESALQPDARSPVGAMGLLQLMPSTARAVARRQGRQLRDVEELYDPQTNVALGVAHLAELEERFDNDWRLVAAAYNAGINAVERWLNRDNVPADLPRDVWVETLPFYETRDYVPRVLAFATIYEWQMDRSPRVLSEHMVPDINTASDSGFVCALP